MERYAREAACAGNRLRLRGGWRRRSQLRGWGRGHSGPGGGSAQGQDVSLLPVLQGVGVPTGALVPDVAGHGEGDHLGGTQAANVSQEPMVLRLLIGSNARPLSPTQRLDSRLLKNSQNASKRAT